MWSSRHVKCRLRNRRKIFCQGRLGRRLCGEETGLATTRGHWGYPDCGEPSTDREVEVPSGRPLVRVRAPGRCPLRLVQGGERRRRPSTRCVPNAGGGSAGGGSVAGD